MLKTIIAWIAVLAVGWWAVKHPVTVQAFFDQIGHALSVWSNT